MILYCRWTLNRGGVMFYMCNSLCDPLCTDKRFPVPHRLYCVWVTKESAVSLGPEAVAPTATPLHPDAPLWLGAHDHLGGPPPSRAQLLTLRRSRVSAASLPSACSGSGRAAEGLSDRPSITSSAWQGAWPRAGIPCLMAPSLLHGIPVPHGTWGLRPPRPSSWKESYANWQRQWWLPLPHTQNVTYTSMCIMEKYCRQNSRLAVLILMHLCISLDASDKVHWD